MVTNGALVLTGEAGIRKPAGRIGFRFVPRRRSNFGPRSAQMAVSPMYSVLHADISDEWEKIFFFLPPDLIPQVASDPPRPLWRSHLDCPSALLTTKPSTPCASSILPRVTARFTPTAFWPCRSRAPFPRSPTSAPPWSYVGRSLFSAYPWLNANVEELRILRRTIFAADIAANDQFGAAALALPVTLVESGSPSGLTLSWPSWAVGFVPQSTGDLASGIWTTLPTAPTLAADQWSVTVPQNDSGSMLPGCKDNR